MNAKRRSLAALACTLFLPTIAWAQGSYPAKPVHVVVPFAVTFSTAP